MPVRQIAARVGASQSSVSVWVRDIELTPEQRAANLRRAGAVRGDAWRATNRARRATYQGSGREKARRSEDPLHVAGCMLYWAEGAKNRNTARLANSDLSMLAFFKRFTDVCFGLKSNRYSFSINVYLGNGLSIRDVEDHWLSGMELPRSCLRKHQINHHPTSSSGQRVNKLPYGVGCLTILKSTAIVQHIYGAIQEYAGFEEPRWLDGPPRKARSRSKKPS